MGIFHQMVEVINRSSKPLTGRFDGQEITILPNYNAKGELLEDVQNMVPRLVVQHLKSQNVVMDTEDPLNPLSFQSLIGMVAPRGHKQKDEIDYLEQDENAVTRVNRKEFEDDKMIKTKVRGRKKPSTFQALQPLNSEFQERS